MAEQKTGEPRYTYRLPPCPSYDVEGTESWLSAMAEKDMCLQKMVFYLALPHLKGATAEAALTGCRHRSSPIGALSENTLPEDAEDLYASFGWRYVCARGQFHIFARIRPMRQS